MVQSWQVVPLHFVLIYCMFFYCYAISDELELLPEDARCITFSMQLRPGSTIIAPINAHPDVIATYAHVTVPRVKTVLQLCDKSQCSQGKVKSVRGG